jgi:hypothetical protein
MTEEEKIVIGQLIRAAHRFLERTKSGLADTDEWRELAQANGAAATMKSCGAMPIGLGDSAT